MSRSSLWVMDEHLAGEELVEFSNSHLFSPMAWDILFEKYLPNETQGLTGKKSFIIAAMFDESIHVRLNEKINNSTIQEDRIVWELTQQQVFFTKDKVFVADVIKRFLTVNKVFSENLGAHIHERFQEVANEILELDERTQPYFIFKNTSVDDGVEYWFHGYDEDEEDYISRTLKDIKQNVTEFVVIENNRVKEFIPNTDFLHTK